jgi:glycosyltransferase involved in cell wall biosynthesis
MKAISAVVCAFNEAERIGGVLSAAHGHPLLSEVIVVDDGSLDGTADVVLKYHGVNLVKHAVNRGKSVALATGIRAAGHETILMLDADLEGLTAENITELVRPVLEGVADVSMSIRANSLLVYKIIGLDFVSGERVLPKSLFENQLDEMEKLPGYGIEVFINRLIIKNNPRVRTVKWNDVVGPRKASKVGFMKGTIADTKMIVDILHVISPHDIFVQNYRILSLID